MKPEQEIVCEGCGSKWLVISTNCVQIIARLTECPLCERKEEAP